MSKKIFSSKKIKIFTLSSIGLFVLTAAILTPYIADAFLDIVQNGFFQLLIYIMQGESAVMNTMTAGFSTFIQYQGYFNEDFVQTGWAVMRDLVNLLFILVLMIIALMSILRVEESVVRHLLPPFVFAVLLVNFSFFLCRVVVGLADSLSLGFTGAIQGLSSAIFNYVAVWKNYELVIAPEQAVESQAITAALIAVFFLAMLMIALLIISAAMLVRIVVLSILIILSPLAFLALILPATSGLTSKWFKNLMSYAFWGPAATFFVWLSVITFVSKGSSLTKSLDATALPSIGPASNSTVGQLLKFVVVAIFLYVAVIAGKLLGNTGADLGMKAVGAAGKLVGKAAGFAGGGLLTATGLRGFGKGLKSKYDDYKHEKEEIGKEKGREMADGLTAAFKNLKNKNPKEAWKNLKKANQATLIGGGKFAKKIHKKEESGRIKKHKEEAKRLTKAGAIERFRELHSENDSDSLEEKQAILELGSEEGFVSDLLGEDAHRFDGTGKAVLPGVLQGLGYNEKDAKKLAERLSSLNKTSDKGDKRFAGLADYKVTGPESGQYASNTVEEYAKGISENMAKQVNQGVLASKKVPGKMFDPGKNKKNMQTGMAAIAGIDTQIDSFSGKEIPYASMFNEGALTEMRKDEYKNAVPNVQNAIKAAGADKTKDKDDQNIPIDLGDGNKVVMSVGRAKKYIENVAKAHGDAASTTAASTVRDESRYIS